MENRCRWCHILREITGSEEYFRTVRSLRASLPEEERTPDAEYEVRLILCRDCGELQGRTCMQCGCFVDAKAARLAMHCPMELW